MVVSWISISFAHEENKVSDSGISVHYSEGQDVGGSPPPMCHSTPRPRWLLQPTDHATIRAPPVRWPIRLLLGLTAAKTVRRARASGRVWKPDSASFEAAERKRGRAAAERLSDLSERKASPSRRATEGRTWMADDGNGSGKEGSTQMLAYFMEEGEAAVCGGGVL